MKKNTFRRRSLAALLAMVMALTLTPAAAALPVTCPLDGTVCRETIVVEATCSQKGKVQYTCPKAGCSYSTVQDLDYNRGNHEMVYTDNFDGTHSGVCRYHTDVTTGPEDHRFANGICAKCGATDYSAVSMDLPAERVVPVALGDTAAKLSAGAIRLTLGSANITDDYDLSYYWYDYSQGGRPVGEGAEFSLPASVYGNRGTYSYSLVVWANPKGTISRMPLSQTCRITVQVADLITASAIITTEDRELRLGDADGWSADSVSNQIYAAVQDLCGRNARPDYVCFKDVQGDGTGRLEISGTSTKYYFGGTDRDLENVRFIAGDKAGDFVAGFTAYDTGGESYAGMLTITVQQYSGDMDVLYIASRSKPLTLSAKDFEAFWQDRCPNGELEYICFDNLPRSVDGTLYTEYETSFRSDPLRLNDELYVEPTGRQFAIDGVAFDPGVGVKQGGYITLEFTGYGTRSTGRATERQGVMYIFFMDETSSADVSVAASGETALDPAAFRKAYQAAMGGTGTDSFYIQLIDVPASGALYLNRSASAAGTLLTRTNVEGRLFACGASRGETVGALTYVPGTAASESVRYVASSTQGKPLFAGNIRFTSAPVSPVTTKTVEYSCTATGVTFRGADFENLPGVNAPKLYSVSFTPPAALYGTLYHGRTAVSAGTQITTNVEWFSVSSAAAGAKSVNDISFVPSLSCSSPVTIPFTGIDAAGGRYTGNVRITIQSGTDNPGSTNPGTSNPGAARPVKTFSDVPKSEWYYPYVTDLTTSGVLKGYEDNTFRPNGLVTMGEALKMIMTSVGYPEQARTDTHWASGYLARAKADDLLPSGTIERLDRTIDRYTIAMIAARAMKLSTPAITVSPFSDMPVNAAAAPSVAALNSISILLGKPNTPNKPLYQGEYAIIRSEFATIIWKVQNYMKTGNANGTAAG